MLLAAMWILRMQSGPLSSIILHLSAISVLVFLESTLLLRHCVSYTQQKQGNRERRERKGKKKEGGRKNLRFLEEGLIALGERN